jgi:predicted transcriptional regulator
MRAPESVPSNQLRDTLHKRAEVLDALSKRLQTKPELVETLDLSRSTIDRAVRDLEDADCVRRTDGEYHLTPLGRVSLDKHREYAETVDGLFRSETIINSLPKHACIDEAFLRRVDVYSADPKAPESALKPVLDKLKGPENIYGLAPVVLSIYTDVFERLVEDPQFQAEVIVHEAALDSLVEFHRERIRKLAERDSFDFHVTDRTIPYALWIVERATNPIAGITVHDNGGIRGLLMNDTTEAVEWARSQYDKHLSNTDT